MIRSMTGYGRAEVLRGGRKITAEIKSLNHRYLEVAVRLPSALTALELEIRRKVGERFVRGRVEVTIRVDGQADAEGGSLRVNWPAVLGYRRMLEEVREKLDLPDPVTLEMIASLRDAFTREDDSDAWAEAGETVAEVVEKAVGSALEMREREGEILCRDLRERVEMLRGWLEGIAAKGPELVVEYQKRLAERVCEGRRVDLLGSGYNQTVLPPAWLALVAGSAGLEIDVREPYLFPLQKDSGLTETKQTVDEVKRNLKGYWNCFGN